MQLCPCLSSRQSIEADPGKVTGQQSQRILTLAKAADADEVTNDATSAATAQRLCWSLVDISRTICHQCQIMLQFQFQQSSDHHAKSSGSVSCLETTAYKLLGHLAQFVRSADMGFKKLQLLARNALLLHTTVPPLPPACN